MRPIPERLKKKLEEDPFMQSCIYNFGCNGGIEWEHALIYAGRQINEQWAIIPCCIYHHRGRGLNKILNELVALSCIDDLSGYKKSDLQQKKEYLNKKYGCLISPILKNRIYERKRLLTTDK